MHWKMTEANRSSKQEHKGMRPNERKISVVPKIQYHKKVKNRLFNRHVVDKPTKTRIQTVTKLRS